MAKEQTIQIRVTTDEKLGFQASADLSGIPLSAWVRERLRQAAIRDLAAAGRRAPFIASVHLGSIDGS